MITNSKRLIKIIVLLCLVLFLTGCQSLAEGIEVETHLPELTELHFLIQCTKTAEPEHPDTEIANYLEDDFVCADIWKSGAHIAQYSNPELLYDDEVTFRQLQEYMKAYPLLRLAVTDGDGMILKVSPTFSLPVAGKNLFYDKIRYDFESNEITGLETSTLDYSHFNSLLKWTGIAFVSTLILGISGVLVTHREIQAPVIQPDTQMTGLLILMMFLTWMFHTLLWFVGAAVIVFGLSYLWRKLLILFPEAPKVLFPVLWFVCSVPVWIMMFLQYQEFFTPYYQTDPEPAGWVFFWILPCDLPWMSVSVLLWKKFHENYFRTV